MNKRYLFVRSKFLLPISEKLGLDTRIEDGFVLFDSKSNIVLDIGEYSVKKGKEIITNFGKELKVLGSTNQHNLSVDNLTMINGIALPGFVKAHGHDHESPIIGVAKDVPLTEWLDSAVNYFTGFMSEKFDELESNFGVSPYFLTYLKAKIDDISFGITTAVAHHCNFNKYHVDELVEATKKAGTNIIIAIGSQDRNYDTRILDTPKEAIERLDNYFEKHKNEPNVTIIPGPDQFFSNGPEMLKSLKKWAREHKTLFHIHSSEEPNTTKWFVETYGMTPIEYADSIDILDEDTFVAHQVNNTEHDLEILANKNVKVIHNPLANTILGSGMPPILDMLDRGIKIAISTDGSGSADNQNMINAARVAAQYQKALNQNANVLPAQKVLEMITIEPAKILNINAGSLEKNKKADLIIVDIEKPNMIPTRLDTVTENLIWASSGNEIKYVVANGKILVDNYEFKTVDTKKLFKEINELSKLFGEYTISKKPSRETGARISE